MKVDDFIQGVMSNNDKDVSFTWEMAKNHLTVKEIKRLKNYVLKDYNIIEPKVAKARFDVIWNKSRLCRWEAVTIIVVNGWSQIKWELYNSIEL